jgi:uncharacterized lipoprotein YddW (UPF0748 family)
MIAHPTSELLRYVFRGWILPTWIAALLIGMGARTPCGAVAETPRYQAVWVDAFHDGFKTPDQTRQLIEWARRNGINALFIEVRKAGDAYYRSKIEPVAPDITPPGYDPLADLIAQAHDTRAGRSRIEIHAWLIVYRIGTGQFLPPDHVARRHPEWLSATYRGGRNDEGNIFLDPGVPDVINHTDRVVADLVTQYDLDGVHFDRIRYPGRDWGYNAIAVSRFRSIARRLLRPRPDDPTWAEFRRQQISMMLRRLYITAKSRRPAIKVSAATIAFDECPADFRQSRAYNDVFQDWPTWALADLLDLNCLMVYKRDEAPEQAAQYRRWLDFLALHRGSALAVAGQGGFLNPPSGSLRQISLALQRRELSGVCLFSYAQMAREGDRGEMLAELLRDRHFRRGIPTPTIPSPEQKGLGWIAGTATVGGKSDYLEITLAGNPSRTTHTDGSGFFAFVSIPKGEYQVSVPLGRGKKAPQSARVIPGKVSWVRIEQ